jgi:peptidoglycan/LPS O-acetylase OafA/YrhL
VAAGRQLSEPAIGSIVHRPRGGEEVPVTTSRSCSFVGWTLLAVGALMVLQWLVFLATGNVPELHTEPLAIGFHLAAEAATAVLLMIAGVRLLQARGSRWGPVAVGMLIYTVINSAGYFAEQGAWGVVAVFGALLVVAIVAAVLLGVATDRPTRGRHPTERR